MLLASLYLPLDAYLTFETGFAHASENITFSLSHLHCLLFLLLVRLSIANVKRYVQPKSRIPFSSTSSCSFLLTLKTSLVTKQLKETHPLHNRNKSQLLQYSRFEREDDKEDVLLKVKEQFSITVKTTTRDCNSQVMISTAAPNASQTSLVAEQEWLYVPLF